MPTMDGKDEDGRFDNVVRLPREWVRTDELVPVGPSARARAEEKAAAQAAASAAGADEHPGIESPKPVPAASDFWGEDAAAVQHAICADGAQPLEPVEPSPRPRTRRRRPTLSSGAPARLLVAPRLRIDRRRAIRAAGVAGTLLIAAVIVLLVVGRGNHTIARPPAATASTGQLVDFSVLTSSVRTSVSASVTATRHAGRILESQQRARRARALQRRRAREAAARRRRRRAIAAHVQVSVSASSANETATAAPETPTSSGSADTSASTGSAQTTVPAYGYRGLLGAGHGG